MSHYAVAVFESRDGENLEDLLAPFDENLSVPHYIPKAYIIAKVRKEIKDCEETIYTKYIKDPQKYIDDCEFEEHIKYISEEFPKRLSWTDEECYTYGVSYYEDENIKPDGSVFSNYNPNSKWDWYAVGGRWREIIPLKDGSFCDSASMREVDVEYRDEKVYKNAIRFWELYVDGQEPKTETDKELIRFVLDKKEYFVERYGTAECYAAHQAGFQFYAALLPTGEWLEPGKMGWWGISSASIDDYKAWDIKVKEIMKQAIEKDWQITIVDCHI